MRIGDWVKTGQPIGKLGNTVNSIAPHLHFQLADGPDNTTSNSLLFVIDCYRFVGSGMPDSPDTICVEGKSRFERRTHHLIDTITDFGGEPDPHQAMQVSDIEAKSDRQLVSKVMCRDKPIASNQDIFSTNDDEDAIKAAIKQEL